MQWKILCEQSWGSSGDMDLCFVGLFEVVAQAAVPNGFDIGCMRPTTCTYFVSIRALLIIALSTLYMPAITGVTSTGLGEWVITRFWSPSHLENRECHFFRNFANSPLPGYIEVTRSLKPNTVRAIYVHSSGTSPCRVPLLHHQMLHSFACTSLASTGAPCTDALGSR